jgi:hypothetical protein
MANSRIRSPRWRRWVVVTTSPEWLEKKRDQASKTILSAVARLNRDEQRVFASAQR